MRIVALWMILELFLMDVSAQGRSCGCAAQQAKMRCDYYVVKKGDLSKRHFCADYAKQADLDGAAGRAAWYWLLAGKPDKSLMSVHMALSAHHDYAAEYGAFASIIEGDRQAGLKYWMLFKNRVNDRRYALKEKKIVEKLYPTLNFSDLR